MRIFLLLAISALFFFSATAQNMCVSQSDMPTSVQDVIASSKKTERISTLPNGDVLYFVTGLDSNNYFFRECFLFRGAFGGNWKIIPSPSEETGYTIVNPKVNTNWEIEIALVKGGESIPATFSFLQRKFIYKSEAAQQKIKPTCFINFN